MQLTHPLSRTIVPIPQQRLARKTRAERPSTSCQDKHNQRPLQASVSAFQGRSSRLPPSLGSSPRPGQPKSQLQLKKEGASQHRSTIDGAAATMAAGGGRPGGAARAALRVRQRAVPRAAAGHDLCSRARVRAGQLHLRELLRPWPRLPLRRRLLRARDGADRERHGRAPAPPGGLPRPRGAPRRPERRACGRGLQGPRMSSVSSRSLPRR